MSLDALERGDTIDVEYDVNIQPLLTDGRRSRGGTYAAIELEPVG